MTDTLTPEREAETTLDKLIEAIGFTQAQVAATCEQGHDMAPPQQLLDAIKAHRDALCALARRGGEAEDALQWIADREEEIDAKGLRRGVEDQYCDGHFNRAEDDTSFQAWISACMAAGDVRDGRVAPSDGGQP